MDFTQALCGPLCTQILGDYGARIIKVENPHGGDHTRAWGPPFKYSKTKLPIQYRDASGVGRDSAYFLGLNRNKMSVSVDLKKPEGARLIKRLALNPAVTMLVENFIPEKMKSFGLDYDTLKSSRPDLIYGSVSGYGTRGPFSHKPAYDLITQAETGVMSLAQRKTDQESSATRTSGLPITDIFTGLYMHGALMAALHELKQTGKGSLVTTSLFECQLASLADTASAYLLGDDHTSSPSNLGHSRLAPYQAFLTADGKYVAIAALNDKQFSHLCEALDMKYLMETYPDHTTRVTKQSELAVTLQQVIINLNKEDVLSMLEKACVPCGPANGIKEAFEHPQVRALNILKSMHHPTYGQLVLPRAPVHFTRNSEQFYDEDAKEHSMAPPLLGQHTRAVLGELLDLGERDLDDLQSHDIIYQNPILNAE